MPLAIILTKDQPYECYCAGFKWILEIFWCQRYPNLFLTDQCSADINAINKVSIWPKCNTLLCSFYVFQAVWLWLWVSTHNIPIEKHKPLMKIFYNILYADNIIDAENPYRIQ